MSGLKKTNAEPQEPKDCFQQVLEMEAFELYLPPIKPQYNRKTGRFLKGHEPHNKGKSWEEWMSKRGRRKASKGWKNLQLHPARNHPRLIEMQKKKLVAVTDDGKFKIFSCSPEAAEWLGTGSRENIGRCARYNARRKECKHDWRPGQPKGADRVNTDHKYMGIRWYFYDDLIWWDKVETA